MRDIVSAGHRIDIGRLELSDDACRLRKEDARNNLENYLYMTTRDDTHQVPLLEKPLLEDLNVSEITQE